MAPAIVTARPAITPTTDHHDGACPPLSVGPLRPASISVGTTPLGLVDWLGDTRVVVVGKVEAVVVVVGKVDVVGIVDVEVVSVEVVGTVDVEVVSVEVVSVVVSVDVVSSLSQLMIETCASYSWCGA